MPTLSWLGKKKIVNHHLDVPFHVLDKKYKFESKVECKNNSIDNRIIHGDNLAVLKSLLPEFEGKVDCIYIDPPYNTGNEEWVYNDNVNDPRIQKWLKKVVGKENDDLSRHDKWLCMIYPRLKLLHRLLADDGVIFVSLDDNEFIHFKMIMNEIFGESNSLAQIIVQSNKRGHTYKQIAKTHEYLICYGKTRLAELGELSTDGENLPEEDQWGSYSARELRNRNPKFGKFNRPNLFYPFYVSEDEKDADGLYKVFLEPFENAIKVEPFNSLGIESCWRWGTDKAKKNTISGSTKSLFAKKTRDGQWRIFEKYRKSSVKAKSIWLDTKYISEQGTTALGAIGLSDAFQFPKPVDLIKDCLNLLDKDEALILDSFAGSATTAHAALKLNAEDGGNRRFILCEMMDYADSLTAERVRRVMDGYGEGNNKTDGLGGSFEFFKLGEPLFLENELLNESIGIERIRQYVSYSERIPLEQQLPITNNISPSALGINEQTLWLFNYDENAVTSLDLDFLGSLNLRELKQRPSQYVIYADKCVLETKFMQDHGITFKRIPRDILRF